MYLDTNYNRNIYKKPMYICAIWSKQFLIALRAILLLISLIELSPIICLEKLNYRKEKKLKTGPVCLKSTDWMKCDGNSYFWHWSHVLHIKKWHTFCNGALIRLWQCQWHRWTVKRLSLSEPKRHGNGNNVAVSLNCSAFIQKARRLKFGVHILTWVPGGNRPAFVSRSIHQTHI